MTKNNSIKKINIEDIKSPDDIKELSVKELEYLSVSIREFLLDKVSKTGGHLASNLGAVELTLGLHYVFNSPKDKIIWDVGHQAYIHKILTGRVKNFDRLRMTGGLSGFPKRMESSHDIYDTGHSSTSIAAALGMASARDLSPDKEKGEIIAVIGDGSMTGGPAFEALNNVSHCKSKVIIILNDNGMSISKNIGGLSEHLGKLRTSSGYLKAKETVKDTLKKVPVVGEGMKNILANTRDYMKYMMISGGVFFEELGLTYLGPYDGNNMKDVLSALCQAKSSEKSVIVHLITKKGKGYIPAEKDPDKFHGVGPFDLETGGVKSSKGKTYSQIFGETLLNLSKDNYNITAITAAMCEATGLGEMKKEYPGRVFDVGIAEAYGVIFAAGQAISGLHPYVAIYSSFLQRAYDELLEDICLQNLPVTFALDRSGIVGADGETHHGIFDLSYLLPMPNMTVLAPSTGKMLEEMLRYTADFNSPSAIRYPRGEAYENMEIPEFDGGNIRLYTGKDVEIFAVGHMVPQALEARNLLKEDGIDAGIVLVSLVKDGRKEFMEAKDYHFNGDTSAKVIVTLEDNLVTGGFGEYFIGNLMREGVLGDRKAVLIGWPNKFIEQGSTNDLYHKYQMDSMGIYNQIKDLI